MNATHLLKFSQLALTGIAGTWLIISQLNLGKRKEKREIEKETVNQTNIFVNNIYIPLKNIKSIINNIALLNTHKNKIFYKNSSICKTPYNHLPKLLKQEIRYHLYKHILRTKLIYLSFWSKNINNKILDKQELYNNIGNDYIWIVNKHHKYLSKINYNIER